MSSNIDGFLAQKYNILGQEAAARTTAAQGEASLANARAKYEVPAQAGLAMSQAGHLDTQSRLAPQIAQGAIGLQGAQGDYYSSHAALNRADLFPDAHLRGAVGALYQQMKQGWQNGAASAPGAAPVAPAPAGRNILDNGPKGGNTGDAYGGTAAPVAPTHLPGFNANPAANASYAPSGSFMDLTQPLPVPGIYGQGFAEGTSNVGNWQDRANASVDAAVARNGQPVHQPISPAPGAGYACGTSNAHNYAGGTDQVPGQGTGAVDKVPAMLAPHEAVLNAGAANHVGRHLIDVLNALGAHNMAMAGNAPQPGPQDMPQPAPGRGMPAPKGKAASKAPVKAAGGTSDVRKSKPTPTPQAVPAHQADDPLGWNDPVTAANLRTAQGFAQGTSFVQGFGGGAPAPMPAPQSSNNDYAAALVRQDPARPANVAADMRAKLMQQTR